ncbi:DNA repair protein [Roseovarius aestuarii]|nr:DNA repair protein [Roseovarius aestuarii]
MSDIRAIVRIILIALHQVAMAVIVIASLAITSASALAAFEVIPWLDFPLSINGAPIPEAGMYAQIAVNGLVVCLLFFLPGSFRVMRLETSHRQFMINMEDVARAYSLAHNADRAGLFQTHSEFDAVRERLAHLREHPDLQGLEPEVLEVAAQMSRISDDLARTYSDERVARARAFLTQRQEEIALFEQRLDAAKLIHGEMRHWLRQLELDEAVAQSQLERLKAEIVEIFPEFAIQDTESAPADPPDVIRLRSLVAE